MEHREVALLHLLIDLRVRAFGLEVSVFAEIEREKELLKCSRGSDVQVLAELVEVSGVTFLRVVALERHPTPVTRIHGNGSIVVRCKQEVDYGLRDEKILALWVELQVFSRYHAFNKVDVILQLHVIRFVQNT